MYVQDGKKSRTEELLIRAKCVDIFHPHDVDVVIMNTASNLMNYNIINKGKLIHANNENKRIVFETSIMFEYLDREYHERMQAEIGIARIASRGLEV